MALASHAIEPSRSHGGALHERVRSSGFAGGLIGGLGPLARGARTEARPHRFPLISRMVTWRTQERLGEPHNERKRISPSDISEAARDRSISGNKIKKIL